MAAPVFTAAARSQVIGSEVQLVEVEPKFAVALLHVQPAYQVSWALRTAPIQVVASKKVENVLGLVAVTAVSLAPLMKVLARLAVKASLLLFEPEPKMFITWVAL